MSETPPAESLEGGESAQTHAGALPARRSAGGPAGPHRRRRRWRVWLPRQIKWVEALYPLIGATVILLSYFLLTGRLIDKCAPGSPVCTPVQISDYLKGRTDECGRTLCASERGSALALDEAVRLWPGRLLWVFATGVLLIACAICVAVSLRVIWKSFGAKSLDKPHVRPYPRGAAALAVGITLLLPVLLVVAIWAKSSPREFMPQMAQLLECTAKADLPSVLELAYWTNVISVAVTACLVLASCALLVPPHRGRHQTLELAARMNQLRGLLYAGTAVLVAMVLRVRITANWALSFLTPWGDADTARGEAARAIGELTSAFTTAQSASNTLMLVAVYVPAFLVLRGRAAALADRQMLPPAREEWLKACGLSFSFSEFAPRLVAILGPLLAGPVGELLGRLS